MKKKNRIEIKLDDKLFLRQTTLDDAEEIFQVVDRNRDHLREFLPWLDFSTTVQDSIENIKESDLEFEESGTPRFCLILNDKMIGTISFHPINKLHKHGSIGYWMDKSFTRNGYLTKAAKALVKYGFEILDLNRIEIRCNTKNIASQRVAEKLGFCFEGTLRECENLYGVFADNKLYSLLRSEYYSS